MFRLGPRWVRSESVRCRERGRSHTSCENTRWEGAARRGTGRSLEGPAEGTVTAERQGKVGSYVKAAGKDGGWEVEEAAERWPLLAHAGGTCLTSNQQNTPEGTGGPSQGQFRLYRTPPNTPSGGSPAGPERANSCAGTTHEQGHVAGNSGRPLAPKASH